MCSNRAAPTVLPMGFMDKALKVAVVARDHFEETRHRPDLPAAPDPHEHDLLARAVALGAPDPYALLSLEEATEIAGVPLGGPRLTYSDDTIGVRYAATGPRNRRWSVEAQAFYAADEDTPFDPAVHWHTFVAEHVAGDDGVPVPGLGDAALARDGEVYVLAGPLLFHTEARMPDDPATQAAIAAARCVLQRLDR
jgi:hypothetical protein